MTLKKTFSVKPSALTSQPARAKPVIKPPVVVSPTKPKPVTPVLPPVAAPSAKPGKPAPAGPVQGVSEPALKPIAPTASTGWPGKVDLTPIDVRPKLELMDNPMLRDIERKSKNQPRIMRAALGGSKTPEEAFNKLFAKWGHDPVMDKRAIAELKRTGRLKAMYGHEADWQDVQAEEHPHIPRIMNRASLLAYAAEASDGYLDPGWFALSDEQLLNVVVPMIMRSGIGTIYNEGDAAGQMGWWGVLFDNPLTLAGSFDRISRINGWANLDYAQAVERERILGGFADIGDTFSQSSTILGLAALVLAGLGVVTLPAAPMSATLFALATQAGTASTFSALAAGANYLLAEEPQEAFEEGVSALLGYGTHFVVEDAVGSLIRLRSELFGEVSSSLALQGDELDDALELAKTLGQAIGNLLGAGWSGVTDYDQISESFEVFQD